MAETPTVERRKYPSRKRAAFDVTYRVLWNDGQHAFAIYRNGEQSGPFTRDKATALDRAVTAAQQEEIGLKVSVSSLRNGKTVVEWCR
jgi:hypothetical protein